jgi:glucosamine--fructose-6-phosphate aminotransferase (isomerizing)
MAYADYATFREIHSQTQAWSQALELAGRLDLGPFAGRYEQVIFTGCGSTYYLSLAAAALYQELTGRSARAIPGGELLLDPELVTTEHQSLLVAVSRSGTTTETVRAVERFRQERRGPVIVIGNYDEQLARQAETSIIIPAGQEDSVAQTRSFASMYVAAVALCARMAGRNDLLEAMRGLAAAGDRLIGRYAALAREIGEQPDHDRFYFLGSGIRYGLACETNLKMKEMALTHSEAFHFLEFRHGPMSMVNGNTVVVGMLSESNARHEQAVLGEMQALGAETLVLAESGGQVTFDSGMPEPVRGVLYLPILQLLAFHRSVAKGLNPDRPNHLTAVVKLDL